MPALLPRAWFRELMADVGDQGARELLARRRAEVAAVVNETLAFDVDRDQDLDRVEP